MKRTQIEISVSPLGEASRKTTVDGYLVGEHLAVHRSYGAKDRWKVTHVRTGFSISGRALLTTRKKAVVFAEVMDGRLSWDFSGPNDARKLNQAEAIPAAFNDAFDASCNAVAA